MGETALMQAGEFNASRQGLDNVLNQRAQFGGCTGVPGGFHFADAIVPGPRKLLDYLPKDEAVKADASGNLKIKGKCCSGTVR